MFICLIKHNAYMEVNGQLHAPAAVTRGKALIVPFGKEAEFEK
jgi:hypothetical protein